MKPGIPICAAQPDEALLADIRAGLEEEGIFYFVIDYSGQNVSLSQMASDAAVGSAFNCGIAVLERSAVLKAALTSESIYVMANDRQAKNNAFITPDGRLIGQSAGRLAKRCPLRVSVAQDNEKPLWSPANVDRFSMSLLTPRLSDSGQISSPTNPLPDSKNSGQISSRLKLLPDNQKEGEPAVMVFDLALAKALVEPMEKQATTMGFTPAITFCGDDGRPILTHVMDGALIVSFEAAARKAFTAVALKMPTEALQVLVQPGQMFNGAQTLAEGKILAIGGGRPLMANGQIIGGLGVSGGTALQDAALAEWGAKLFEAVWMQLGYEVRMVNDGNK